MLPCDSEKVAQFLQIQIADPFSYPVREHRELLAPTLSRATITIIEAKEVQDQSSEDARSCRARVILLTNTTDGIALTQIGESIAFRVEGNAKHPRVVANLAPLANAILQRFTEPLQ